MDSCPACGGTLSRDARRCPHCGIAILPDSPDSREVHTPARGERIPVFRGEMSQVLPLRAALTAAGIEAAIQDEEIKYLDPFLTGGYGFSVTLLVPRSQAERALGLIRKAGAEPESPQARPKADLESLARRIRWAALCMVTGPLGLVLFFRYLRRTLGNRIRPKGYGLTMAAGGFCVLLTCLFVWYVAMVMTRNLPSPEYMLDQASRILPSFGF